MQLIPTTKPIALLAVLALWGLAGCVYENEPPRRLASEPTRSGPSGERSSTSTGGAGGGAASTIEPMLVEVDSDQTMTAVGGDGVGVFVEYGRGGHWHVWWTCDTNQTRQRCDFAITLTADSLSNVDASELPSGAVRTPSASSIDAMTTTTTQTHGVRFDTAPGAAITVEASVGGLRDGSFLFFVQDGKVNGGFPGVLTNPLQLQGSSP